MVYFAPLVRVVVKPSQRLRHISVAPSEAAVVGGRLGAGRQQVDGLTDGELLALENQRLLKENEKLHRELQAKASTHSSLHVDTVVSSVPLSPSSSNEQERRKHGKRLPRVHKNPYAHSTVPTTAVIHPTVEVQHRRSGRVLRSSKVMSASALILLCC
jgi:hypothetical protein